ncbi:PIN domain-containing protein [Candidatus Woesearchaeota archaeon]|nr:PIN domain-containing protein [Candidatus Woesearchaeota archaeon]
MQKKTQQKIKKREKLIPSHHIDGSVLSEILVKGNDFRNCEQYICKTGSKYHRGTISIFALGEIIKAVHKRIEDTVKRELAITRLLAILSERNIRFISPQFEDMKLALCIRKILKEIEPADALHLACAINKKANVFVTLDGYLWENREIIQKKYNIKIKKPNSKI